MRVRKDREDLFKLFSSDQRSFRLFRKLADCYSIIVWGLL